MLKIYNWLFLGIVVSIILFGFVLPKLMSHKGDEPVLLGTLIIAALAYFGVRSALLLTQKIVSEQNKNKKGNQKENE